MSKSIFAGAGMLAFMSAISPAVAQMSETTLNLRGSCADLRHPEDIRYCQRAFVAAAENMVKVQKAILTAPHYIRVGRADDPEMVQVSDSKQNSQVFGLINKFCRHIGNKDQMNAESERLDDGSRIGLLRIAERAIVCARMTQTATSVVAVPMATSLVKNLELNAEDVKWQINKIALAY